MSTHINAKKGEIADKILLPGDPLRAKYIAETFLEDAKIYNEVRNMFGYTGFYKGKRVSVQGTGMGMPSISIYVNELLREYDVKSLIRVGSCGSYSLDVKIRDLILAIGATTNSNVNNIRFDHISYSPTPDFNLLRDATEYAKKMKMPYHVGNIYSSDLFYNDKKTQMTEVLQEYNVLGVEMEAAELYTLAAKFRAKALAVLTVSDHAITKEETSSKEREKSFNDMIELALNII